MSLAFLSLAAALCVAVLALLWPPARRSAPAAGPTGMPGSAGPGPAWGWLAAVPALAIGVYGLVGHPEAVTSQAVTQSAEGDGGAAARRPESLAALEARTRSHPEDVQAWRVLARAHESARDFSAAVQAYRRLRQLQPGDVAVLSDLAVALAMAEEDHPSPEPEALLQQALALQPDHVETLALLGSLRYARQDYAGAVSAWEPILARLSADSPVAASISDNIARARALAGAKRRP